MSCCGSQRASISHMTAGSAAPEGRFWNSGAIEFEYSGSGALTVTGPLTGLVYRFLGGGARLLVHGSDAPSFVSVPGLRAIR